MNQGKEILEILTKTQTKQMELFLETMRTVAEAWGKENFVEVFSEAYKTWFEEQSKLMQEMNTLLQQHAGVNMPNHLLDLQKMQENFGTKWVDYIKDNAGNYFNTDMLKGGSVEQLNEVWNKMYGAWFEPFMRPFKEFSASGVGSYNMMIETVKDYLKAFSGNKKK
jgi:enamine deaminase RidA (YjgF/YER057c/UK114 family)